MKINGISNIFLAIFAIFLSMSFLKTADVSFKKCIIHTLKFVDYLFINVILAFYAIRDHVIWGNALKVNQQKVINLKKFLLIRTSM